MTVSVLDKGSVTLLDHMGSDLTVVNAARVSFSKKSEMLVRHSDTGETMTVSALLENHPYNRKIKEEPFLSEADTKLIQYLAKHEHWTPFGHPQLQFHMKMPIFVARQFMRSNIGIVYNEVSRRYVDSPPEFYEPSEWRGRPPKSLKQGSSNEPVPPGLGASNAVVSNFCSLEAYKHLLDDKVAPEMARMVLPLSTYTEFWATMSLAACARVVNLRSDAHAQKEIQAYAAAISSLVQPIFPISWEALTRKEPNA